MNFCYNFVYLFVRSIGEENIFLCHMLSDVELKNYHFRKTKFTQFSSFQVEHKESMMVTSNEIDRIPERFVWTYLLLIFKFSFHGLNMKKSFFFFFHCQISLTLEQFFETSERNDQLQEQKRCAVTQDKNKLSLLISLPFLFQTVFLIRPWYDKLSVIKICRYFPC